MVKYWLANHGRGRPLSRVSAGRRGYSAPVGTRVVPREQPLVREGREVFCYRTPMNTIEWLEYFNRENETTLDASDRLMHLLRARRVRSVLDAGAGIGVRALALARAGYDVVACEADRRLFERAGRRIAAVEEVTIPLYRLGLPGIDEVAFGEGPFDAVLALNDVIARWPHHTHVDILDTLAGTLDASGVLIVGFRDWQAQLRTRDYFVPRRVARMNGSRLLMFEVWEYTTAAPGAAVATTFYLYTYGGPWHVETTTATYYPIYDDEFRGVVEHVGLQVVERIEHPREQWWVLRKGKEGHT